MTTRRVGWGIALGAVVALGAVLTCGGRIALGVEGTLDDAGVFHLPDGGILFSPGSACVGYDAAAWTHPPCTTQCLMDSGEPQACLDWAAALGPPALSTHGYCRDNGGDDAGQAICDCEAVTDLSPPCDYTNLPAANAFCTAWSQQFVTGGGTAVGRCYEVCVLQQPDGGVVVSNSWDPCYSHAPGASYRGNCIAGGIINQTPHPCGTPNSPNEGCGQLDRPFCVTRNGVSQCEPPCAP